jgi:uncharacterized protein YoxC
MDDAGNIAAVVAAVAAVVAVILLAITLRAMTRTLDELRASVDDIRRTTVPAVEDVRDAVRQANTELARVDDLLGTAESISVTLDAGSRLAYLLFSNPVIKALALASGTSRAYRRFRRVD